MASSSPSSSALLIDAQSGSLDMRKLQQELVSKNESTHIFFWHMYTQIQASTFLHRKTIHAQTQALHDDQQYSRVDAMKKRAIKTVASYDEFKNLVACAHLTPLSRREIDCLGHVKQGWKGHHGGGIKGRVGGPSKSRVHRGDGNDDKGNKAGAVPVSSSSSPSKIISSLAFEKAWSRMQQRHQPPEEKMAYLLSVGGADFLRRCFGGGADVKKKKEMSAEILGDILTTLHQTHIQKEREEGALILLVQFLYALTLTGRFHITYALLTRPQQEAAHEMVRMLEETEKEQSRLDGEEGSKLLLETIQEAFQCV